MAFSVQTYYHKEELPPMEDINFFHSPDAFDWYSCIPAYTPFMLVAFNDEKPVAALFAIIARKNRLLHHSLFRRCIINQPPSFFGSDLPQIELFELLITRLVEEVKHKVFLIR
ncbi:MAG: hypothetical protein GX976_00145, partial [Bacteroidales bacterium]|nr:hypothetical protein [Bacteroidales bacterium]